MQTFIKDSVLKTRLGEEANAILRNCVHCGFCTATCPTYQLLGDELDSPRGRIYLVKNFLETGAMSCNSQQHLSRCLHCGSCETTCPSGVKYRRLISIGKQLAFDKQTSATSGSLSSGLVRQAILRLLPYPKRFSLFLKTIRLFKPLLPKIYRNKIPDLNGLKPDETTKIHDKKIVLFRGCVQDAIAPDINQSLSRILDKAGISIIELNELTCCGAINYHMQDEPTAVKIAKKNIDLLLNEIDHDAIAIVNASSACLLMLKEYAELFDPKSEYATKAKKLASYVKDVSELFDESFLQKLNFKPNKMKIAFHAPCTLQHGLRIENIIQNILRLSGSTLVKIENSHLCCGSAGTYSITQPEISNKLLANKVSNLEKNQPNIIVTANIGCLTHIQSAANTPVKHWLNVIDDLTDPT